MVDLRLGDRRVGVQRPGKRARRAGRRDLDPAERREPPHDPAAVPVQHRLRPAAPHTHEHPVRRLRADGDRRDAGRQSLERTGSRGDSRPPRQPRTRHADPRNAPHATLERQRTNRVTKTLPIGTTNGDIAFAARAVWTIDERGRLLRVDPDTVAVTLRVPLGAAAPLPDSGGSTLAAAGDTLWVSAGDGDITQIDARTGSILGQTHGPALPLEKARRTGADDSGLWISSATRREIVHVDARTRGLTRHPVPGDPGPLAIVDDRIWVGTLHDTGTLTRVTVLETGGRVVDTMPLPDQAAVNIVPSPGGGAWIAFGENGTVSPAALRIPSP